MMSSDGGLFGLSLGPARYGANLRLFMYARAVFF